MMVPTKKNWKEIGATDKRSRAEAGTQGLTIQSLKGRRAAPVAAEK